MIDYQTFCQIKAAQAQGLTQRQIARQLRLGRITVQRWWQRERFVKTKPGPRPSKLDPYKALIAHNLAQHDFTSQQLLQKLREEGYPGSYSILRNYVARIRPRRQEAFLRVHYAPGECAQLDWGHAGSVRVGNTRRALSFFAMVLCHSRWLYVEFTLGQSMEWFLGCQQRAFRKLGAVPRVLIVDNCKTAVLAHPPGGPVQYHPQYLDFAKHFGCELRACSPRHPESKGMVEAAVAYVKANFLSGRDIGDFAMLEPLVPLWLEEVANVRQHGQTKRRPIDMLAEEKPALLPLPPQPYAAVLTRPVQVCRRCRVRVDGNTYSVPPVYAGQTLTLQLSSEHLRLYAVDKLVAEHPRSLERGCDFEQPDHVRELETHRRHARRERLLARFLALSPKAAAYRSGLQERRFNVAHHVEKIVALAEVYGAEPVDRALRDACELGAFSCEYIANLLEQRARPRPEPGALHLTRASDLLDLELDPPDLSLYGEEAS
jgi:transposase